MSANDVINRALDEIGARANVVDYLTETTPQAKVAQRWYEVSRQRLLRAAPWGFARKTLLLTTLALASDDPNLVPYPWLVQYAYPTDCLKMRYLLPPPFPSAADDDVPNVSATSLIPWGAPSRSFRFLPGFTPSAELVAAEKWLLANVPDAYGVYTADVEDDTLWDALFTAAMEAVLAYHFVMPIAGNAGMKQGYKALALEAVTQARAVDGNEAMPVTDHQVDWLIARATGGGYPLSGMPGGVNWEGLGNWYDAYDLNWGM